MVCHRGANIMAWLGSKLHVVRLTIQAMGNGNVATRKLVPEIGVVRILPICTILRLCRSAECGVLHILKKLRLCKPSLG